VKRLNLLDLKTMCQRVEISQTASKPNWPKFEKLSEEIFNVVPKNLQRFPCYAYDQECSLRRRGTLERD